MPLRVACQMDPIERIDIRGDSTFAILLEAQNRGHEIFYYTPQSLSLDGNTLRARGTTLAVKDMAGDHYKVSNPRTENLAEWNVVLLRQDPPFDMAYITSTHLLERIHPKTLVVNDPAHVRNAPEKVWVLDFLDLMPPTLVTRSADDVLAFRAEHKDIILKPLYGNGGASVFRVPADDTNLGSLVELFQTVFREPFMVQRYLPAVRAGDKRIILVDGEVAGAINRVPAKNETRSNLHAGGTAKPVELTKRDMEICERLGPELKRRGLIFTGIDVIGDSLTEINVTSPTGIRQVKAFGGNDIAAMIWDAIEGEDQTYDAKGQVKMIGDLLASALPFGIAAMAILGAGFGAYEGLKLFRDARSDPARGPLYVFKSALGAIAFLALGAALLVIVQSIDLGGNCPEPVKLTTLLAILAGCALATLFAIRIAPSEIKLPRAVTTWFGALDWILIALLVGSVIFLVLNRNLCSAAA